MCIPHTKETDYDCIRSSAVHKVSRIKENKIYGVKRWNTPGTCLAMQPQPLKWRQDRVPVSLVSESQKVHIMS